jgi:SAM-dependent MidA family methyltransferase
VTEFSPLEPEIKKLIKSSGPLPVWRYMELCLLHPEHGYYVSRDPLGREGDFTTAPEVSQMFGEMIGLWMAAIWKQMGSPENLRIVELGPGRGTLMKDALRAAQVMPAFREAVVMHLVEISPVLEEQQERTLEHLHMPMFWHPSLDDVPKGPAIIIANEFFDALPVNQMVRTSYGWHERQVEIDADGNLAFTVAPDPSPLFDRLLPPSARDVPVSSIFEWRADRTAMELGRRLARDGGAALVIDYGHIKSAAGDTLQAVGQHAFADPLSAPGSLDLTAPVDFEALGRAVEAMGVDGFGPLEQSTFLRRLGIEQRAISLKAKNANARPADIDAALSRLIGEGRGGMGALFKAAAFAHSAVGVPPGFES